jgi:hypothetical protein
MTENATQQLFDLWKRQIDEGTQAWARMLSQAPAAPAAGTAADPNTVWRPVLDQAFQQWARMLAQGPLTPDAFTQWKQLMDQTIEAWSRGLSQIMGTDTFAQSLGKTLDQVLTTTGPMKKAADQSLESALQAMNLPSRSQLVGVAKQIVLLEERIDGLEEILGAITRRLDDIARAIEPLGDRTTAKEPR